MYESSNPLLFVRWQHKEACRGSFGPLHKGKPGEKEIKEVRAFARKVVKNINE